MRRKTDEQVKEELRAIYAGHDGEIPDMTRLETRGGSRMTRWLVRLVLVLGLLSASAWAGFFVWSRGGISPERPLETRSEAPSETVSGQEAFYAFRYENSGNAPIAALSAKLSLPSDFTMTSANPPPTDPKALTWTLDSLSRGSDGSIVVGGVFRSEVPSAQTMQALFTYRPANFSSDFQEIETLRVEVSDSTLDATMTGPEKAVPGDTVTYVVNVQNAGTEPADRVLVSFEPPEGFDLVESEPPADEFWSNAWSFPTIGPGELKAITVKGRYDASSAGEQTVAARVSFLNEDKYEFPQARTETKTDVLDAAIAFGLVVDGSTTEQTADAGDTLRLSLDYANRGSESVKGLSFALAVTSDGGALPVDWAAANLGGGTRLGDTVVWDASAVEALADFAPNASGVIDLAVPLLSSLKPDMSGTLTFAPSASFDQVGSVVGERSVDAPSVVTRINSDFRASAHVEYYDADGQTVGSGPLPPTVGETTAYRIVWRVANSFHALERLRMTASLPAKVAWIDSSSAEIGDISFDRTTRMVTWTVPSLPLSIPGAEAWFDVAITPEASDVGAFYKLTNATSAEATDTYTRDQVSDGIDALNTELPEDEAAAGMGVVGN
jgi:uncharacterized repeat protein (TIGR01451 family)